MGGPPRSTVGRARRLLLGGLLAVCSIASALAVAEASVRLFDLLAPERAILADLAAPRTGYDERAAASKFQLHPMRGRSRRPGTEQPPKPEILRRTFPDGRPTEYSRRNSRANLFGFRSEIDDYRSLPEAQFVVGVFGGSVADDLVALAGDTLAEALEERVPSLRGRVVVLNFGLGGYKQPQQAAALVEAVLLGVPLDAVVNLDGFNEVTLGAQDARDGYHPVFPSRAHLGPLLDLASRAPSAETLELSAGIVAAERRARELAARVDGSPFLGWSSLVRGLAGRLCIALQGKAVALEERLQSRAVQGGADDRMASLPDPRLGTARAPFELIADLWERGSLLMAAMAAKIGAVYVHLLQPNQYVEESKRLSQDELEYAYDASYEWGINAREGYPFLQRRAERLRARGVTFHDLTGIFADIDSTIYSDQCCHMNLEGNRVLARAVAERLADQLDAARELP